MATAQGSEDDSSDYDDYLDPANATIVGIPEDSPAAQRPHRDINAPSGSVSRAVNPFIPIMPANPPPEQPVSAEVRRLRLEAGTAKASVTRIRNTLLKSVSTISDAGADTITTVGPARTITVSLARLDEVRDKFERAFVEYIVVELVRKVDFEI